MLVLAGSSEPNGVSRRYVTREGIFLCDIKEDLHTLVYKGGEEAIPEELRLSSGEQAWVAYAAQILQAAYRNLRVGEFF